MPHQDKEEGDLEREDVKVRSRSTRTKTSRRSRKTARRLSKGDYSGRILNETPDPTAVSESARERNVVAFPLGNLSGRDKTNRARYRVPVIINGTVTEQIWTVETTAKTLPTPFERRVLSALAKVATEQGLTNERFEFTRYQLANHLPHEAKGRGGGLVYKKIDAALMNLAKVTITTNLFYDASAGVYRQQVFQLVTDLDLVHHKNEKHRTLLAEERDTHMGEASKATPGTKRSPRPKSSIRWGAIMFQSIRAGNFTYIDHNLSLRLESPTAVRLHEFLDGEWRGRTHLQYDIRELAHERIGISRNLVHVSELTRALASGFVELEKQNYLVPNSTVVKSRMIHFYKYSEGSAITATSPSAPPSPRVVERDFYVGELVTRGVNERVARDLVEKANPAKLARMPEFLEKFDEDKRNGSVSKNPPGWLVSMIREGWTTRPRRKMSPQPALFNEESEISKAASSLEAVGPRARLDVERARTAWAEIKQELEEKGVGLRGTAQKIFLTDWVKPIQAVAVENGDLVLQVPNGTFPSFLEGHEAGRRLRELATQRGLSLRFEIATGGD